MLVQCLNKLDRVIALGVWSGLNLHSSNGKSLPSHDSGSGFRTGHTAGYQFVQPTYSLVVKSRLVSCLAKLRYSANRRSSEPGLVPCNRGSGLPGIDLALGRRVGRTHPYQSRALPSDLDAPRRNDYAGGINRPSSTSCAARLHRAFGCAHAPTAEQSCSSR